VAETFAGNTACEVRRGDRGLEIGARDKVGRGIKKEGIVSDPFKAMCLVFQRHVYTSAKRHCRIMGSHVSLFVATATI
jgi:hypothetical protein